MNIKIRFVDECPRGEYGTCELTSKRSITIEISRKLNQKKAQFFVTLLHELIHALMFVMRSNGVRMSDKREHEWIGCIEMIVVKSLKLLEAKKRK